MKRYEIVAEEVPTRWEGTWDCDGCLFDVDGKCAEPPQLNCYKNIWVLGETYDRD